jgi:hypothetical protein
LKLDHFRWHGVEDQLEGRGMGTTWTATQAQPLAVNNRVALHLLTSLQRLRIKVPGGGPSEARRVSFRALGVEQIGHVYEGLLDHIALRATETVLGIKGTRGKEAELALTTLEAKLTQGQDTLIDFLRDETGRSASAIKRAMEADSSDDEHNLLIACGHDKELLRRIRPFGDLIREDSFERPVVVLPGSIYVTVGTTRRSTGTHYTPPSLTEPIVQYTLEPLVYQGPAEGLPREQWQLKPPKELLDLKVCDMAMGSGAFLVQACRYLAERLTEAWENEEKEHPDEVLVTPEGGFSQGSPSERLVPQDPAERLAIARRVIADRCLYGVDINSMAVEMAKLSLWLITLDAKRPFTFLDHAFKCGDSLLGLSTFKQLENFSLRPEGGRQIAFSTMNLWRHIEEAKKKREALEAMLCDTPEQVVSKGALYAEAEEAVAKLNAAGDVLLAVELKGLKGSAYEAERDTTADHMMAHWQQGVEALRGYAEELLNGRQTLHWPLAFPEITERGGFDAFVGNPPFVGGKKISTLFGPEYRQFLAQHIAMSVIGSADYSSYFLLRVATLVSSSGVFGLIATDTICQGDTKDVGLNQLIRRGVKIFRAVATQQWPGTASQNVSQIWGTTRTWNGDIIIGSKNVSGIGPDLQEIGSVSGEPKRLESNKKKAFQGTLVNGMGFILTSLEAEELLQADARNREVIQPYLIGDDLNSSPTLEPGRWIINFRDWPMARAAQFQECFRIVTERVKPERDPIVQRGRQVHERDYWKFWDKRLESYEKVNALRRVLITGLASKYVSFSFSQTGLVFAHRLGIVIDESAATFAVLQSSFHSDWAWKYSSTIGGSTINYSLSDAFETFPFPPLVRELDVLGGEYHDFRQKLMLARQEGLTKIYNRFHDFTETSQDIGRLRALHVELDEAVSAAYHWNGLDLGHGFHETKQGRRYTISESARREVLDHLLALNHQRHAEEEAAKGTLGEKANSTPERGRKPKREVAKSITGLFDLGGAEHE